jgi:hypothetical protein
MNQRTPGFARAMTAAAFSGAGQRLSQSQIHLNAINENQGRKKAMFRKSVQVPIKSRSTP